MLTKGYSFKSERLCFRGIEIEDAELIVAWRSNAANYRNFLNANPITLEDHLEWFKGYLNNASRYDFMIIEPNGTRIGTCGLSNIDNESCEVSYMIGDESCRGKGYAKEAVRALVNVAFKELNISHVEARILAHNKASMQVVLRTGFDEYERVYRIEKNDD